MNMGKFTKKSIEALQDTQSLALQNGNQQLEQVHLLSALVSKSDGLIPSLITRAGASAQTVSELCEGIISSLPKVAGLGSDRLYLSRELESVLTESESQAKKMKDEYVSVEHLMLALFEKGDHRIKDIFRRAGLDHGSFLNSLREQI